MSLHPNAAIRVIRREIALLLDGRPALAEAMNDPRVPAGVIRQQLIQGDREIAELEDAQKFLTDWLLEPQVKRA